MESLSPQEKRILEYISEGMTNKQIAESMFLAEHTIKNYMTGLLRKLKMSSRTEAAIYATKRGPRARSPARPDRVLSLKDRGKKPPC